MIVSLSLFTVCTASQSVLLEDLIQLRKAILNLSSNSTFASSRWCYVDGCGQAAEMWMISDWLPARSIYAQNAYK